MGLVEFIRNRQKVIKNSQRKFFQSNSSIIILKNVKKSLINRTHQDKKRKNSPLIKVSDAILIRTDKLSKKQVLSKMSEHIEKLY